MGILAVLTVRNEAAFLLEWLAHHRAVGITDFLVFSNDCQDGTDQMLDQLEKVGQLTHIRNEPPYEGGIQWCALKTADKHPLVKAADWIITLDIDEFINIHIGDHTIQDLIDALPQANAITLTWRLFGNGGIQRYQDQPITEQFCHAAPRIMHWPWRAAMFKTLYRNDGIYRKLGVHRPRSPDKPRLENANWFDASGRPLGDRFRLQQIFSPYGRDNYQLAQLNHYPLGAMESYVLKCDRGRAVHGDDRLGMSYWVERNWDTEEDKTIHAIQSARSEINTGFMSNPALKQIHKAAVDWRHSHFQSLMQQESNRALYGRLMITPSAQPLSRQDAQTIFQYDRPKPVG